MFSKLIKISILLIYIIFLILPIVLSPQATQAMDPLTLQVPIPFSDQNVEINNSTIGNYINAIYKYAVGIVAIIATIVVVFGGVLWITAVGNPSKVSQAQSLIIGSVTGLLLILSSYTILYLVNPQLVSFKPLTITTIANTDKAYKVENIEITGGCCASLRQGDVYHPSDTSYRACTIVTAAEACAGSQEIFKAKTPCNQVENCPQYGTICNSTNDGKECDTLKVCKNAECVKCGITNAGCPCCEGYYCDTSTTPDQCRLLMTEGETDAALAALDTKKITGELTLQVGLPGLSKITINGDAIGTYIKAIFIYAVGAVAIIAMVIMMLGGVIWTTAGGNPSRVSEAKAWISGSLIGLVLVMFSYVILKTINPELVNLKTLNIKEIEKMQQKKTGCCQAATGGCQPVPDEETCTGKGGSAWQFFPDYTCGETKCIENPDGCCVEQVGLTVIDAKCSQVKESECCELKGDVYECGGVLKTKTFHPNQNCGATEGCPAHGATGTW